MQKKSTDELYSKAEELFTSIPQSEVEAWANHPITKSLKQTLYGDMAGYFESWLNGEFTGKNSDETAQKNAKALGAVDAVEAILTWLEDAKGGTLYD
jgi:hypothetical protein